MSLKLSVQAQNDATRDRLVGTAIHFRENSVPLCVLKAFAERGIDFSKSVVLYGETNGTICGYWHGYHGLILTSAKRFFEFEFELDASQSQVIAVHGFCDVTDQQNMSARNRGVGKGFGVIAIEVLEQLNRSAGP